MQNVKKVFLNEHSKNIKVHHQSTYEWIKFSVTLANDGQKPTDIKL